jgi:hypothetical protein
MSSGLYTQPQFTPPQPQPQPQPQYARPARRGGSLIMGVVLVGGGILMLLSLLIVAGVWYAVSSVDRWLVGLGREAIVAVVEDSEIPEQEQTEVIAQVDRVVAAYKAGRIDQDDLAAIFEQLDNAPVFVAMDLGGIEQDIVAPSGLSDDEQQQARRTLERAFRGVHERKIEIADFYAALPAGFFYQSEFSAMRSEDELDNLAEQMENEEFQPATDDQVRKSLARLKQMADAAGIPDEPFSIDIGDEFKKVVDQVLAGKEG